MWAFIWFTIPFFFPCCARRRELGILLTLGFSRGQVSRALLLEISLIAGLGSLIGLGLGYLLARYSLNIINQTISDLYFFLRSAPVRPTPAFIAGGLALGIGSAWGGGLFPAAGTPPGSGGRTPFPAPR